MTAKILLLVFGLSTGDGVLFPLAQMFDTAKGCADAAQAVDLSSYARGMVICVDSSTGQVAYMRAKRP